MVQSEFLMTRMLGKKEKKNKKETVPSHIKWGWLGDGKDWRNDVLMLTLLFTILGIVWYLTEKPPWCTRDNEQWRICEQYYP